MMFIVLLNQYNVSVQFTVLIYLSYQNEAYLGEYLGEISRH